MKRPSQNLRTLIKSLLLVTLTLLAAGCAAPQASTGLQQRIDALLVVQQQQALQLAQLQQQLAGLSVLPLDSPLVDSKPADETAEQLTQANHPATPALSPPASAAEVAAISEASGLYLEAFAAIATGQMAQAEAGFKSFIQKFPAHEYAGNANYWMAEALLAQQKPKYAESVLLGIIDNPEQQNKAPAAMARLVSFYRETGAQSNASAMLQMLNNRYPESPELNRLMRSTEPR